MNIWSCKQAGDVAYNDAEEALQQAMGELRKKIVECISNNRPTDDEETWGNEKMLRWISDDVNNIIRDMKDYK